jgi:hypothetical protein
MFGDLRLAEAQSIDHVSDRPWAVPQQFDDSKTVRLRQCFEYFHHGQKISIYASRHIHVGGYAPTGADEGRGRVGPAGLPGRAGTFTATADMNARRALQTATLLANGEVLVTGGQGVLGTVLATVGLYQ